MKDENIEKRIYSAQDLQLRAATDEETGKRYLEGYAALFGVKSRLLANWERGLFYEIIERGAFDEVLRDPNLDVTFNINHNDDYLIARTMAGTLELSVDDTGLKFRAEIPEGVSYAEDAYKLVETGNLNQNSFAFVSSESDYSWGEYEDDIPIGRLNNIRKLLDTSVVTRGAYEETSIEARSELALRSYEMYVEEQKEEEEVPDYSFEAEARKRKLNLKNKL